MVHHLGDILALHDPIQTLLGICAGFVGAYVVATMLNRVRYHKRMRRTAWLGLTSIYYGMTVWVTQLILLWGLLGAQRSQVDIPALFAAALVALLLASSSLLLAYSTRKRPIILFGRLAVGLVVPVTYVVNLTATLGPVTNIIPVLMQCAAHVLLQFSAMRLYALEHRKKTLKPVAAATVITLSNIWLHFALLSLAIAPKLSALTADAADGSSALVFLLPTILALVLTLAIGGLSILIDTDSGREAAQKYRDLAMFDTLTGQPNRLKLHATIDHAINAHRDGDPSMALVIIDLDNFKEVNDAHGHAAGDTLLKGVAQDIVAHMGPNEMLARMGGDEFVALKFDCVNRDCAQKFGDKILAIIKDFDAWMTGDIPIGASLGVCLFPDDGHEADVLLSRADLAMYRAKNRGRDQVCVYDIDMDEAQRREAELSLELRRAIDESALSLRLQPQFDCASEEIVGFEALMQWSHPELGPNPLFRGRADCGKIRPHPRDRRVDAGSGLPGGRLMGPPLPHRHQRRIRPADPKRSFRAGPARAGSAAACNPPGWSLKSPKAASSSTRMPRSPPSRTSAHWASASPWTTLAKAIRHWTTCAAFPSTRSSWTEVLFAISARTQGRGASCAPR